MINSVLAFLESLPELIKLYNKIQAMNKKAANQKKVKHDIKAINEAFDKGDSEALRRLFNNESD